MPGSNALYIKHRCQALVAIILWLSLQTASDPLLLLADGVCLYHLGESYGQMALFWCYPVWLLGVLVAAALLALCPNYPAAAQHLFSVVILPFSLPAVCSYDGTYRSFHFISF